MRPPPWNDLLLLLAGLALAWSAGCNDRHASPADPSPASATISATGTGKIVGRVFLRGSPPALAPADLSAFPDLAKQHPQGLPDESIVVGRDGGLRNVIVYLRDVSASGSGASRVATVLDQAECCYQPHVIAVQTGQVVRVESRDPFIHNVNVLTAENDPSNFSELAEPGKPATHDLIFEKPEIFPVKCDVHPWMRAWIGVFDHPWFAVTDADGNFTIDHVPAGRFTLVAWQERLGEMTQQLNAADEKTQSVQFTYSR